MKILIDTNVLIDVFYNREPFVQDAQKILNLVEVHQVQGFITANAITDLHYVLTRALKDRQIVREAMKVLLALVEIIDVTGEDVRNAFLLDGVDFEDDLQSVCAERTRMDYIVTRNGKDFARSSVPAIEPGAFLEKVFLP